MINHQESPPRLTATMPAPSPPKPVEGSPARAGRAWRRAAASALIIGLTAMGPVLGSGPAVAAPPDPASSHPTVEPPPGGVPGVRVPVLRWADAGDGYQKTDAAVPYDYADPQGRTFRLHLVRLPASDPAHKIGTLFVNFGGPGAPPPSRFASSAGTSCFRRSWPAMTWSASTPAEPGRANRCAASRTSRFRSSRTSPPGCP